MDLGADLCCDSAHKTLPVLTGGAYLHVQPGFAGDAKQALALFGSTSPSYLIMQSLDLANPYLETLQSSMQEFLPLISRIKEQLKGHGYTLCGDESLKITIDASAFGYTGDQLAEILLEKGVISEFHDPDYLVLMCTPENTEEEMMRVCQALCSIERRSSIAGHHPDCKRPEKAMSVREAVFSPTETIPIDAAEGRILAQSTVGCPPAIPIVMSGERIGADAVRLMQYYGIEMCSVVKR